MKPLPRPSLALLLPLACLTLCAAARVQAEPVTYTLEPSHTSITWEVLHFGTSTIRGRLPRVEGQISWDRDAKRGKLSVQIDMNALETGVAPFTARLKAPDLFATQEHPHAWFVAERLQFDGDRLTAAPGELTLRGTSQPLTLSVVRFNCYLNPLFRREVCGGDFEARVKRSDFGMSFGLPFVANDVLLRVQVEAVKQAAAPAEPPDSAPAPASAPASTPTTPPAAAATPAPSP
ncbi:YceI family protein [Caldimonas brevitalea]|uniref:Lipid/polyisoprenoid-binding YceI-like domain-containing protein n=1 Tax=Caldimonas brevitalea TaxID=413882 RepID=A0A0G3BW83_9BURK|nr:YceI family protein [Caldimonas brevitalea]AKJ31656.1 hypothetical protein AAW51_4965 [Caldimonas brevitalea]